LLLCARQRYERIEEGLGVWVLNKGVLAAPFFEAIQVGVAVSLR
jgi:hypothetical protein